MHEEQYIRQMEKRQKIGGDTLVVGMEDIGSEFNAACFMGPLETYPFPEDVRNAGLPAITALLAKTMRRKNQTQKKAEQIVQAAQESVGLRTIGMADRARLTILS